MSNYVHLSGEKYIGLKSSLPCKSRLESLLAISPASANPGNIQTSSETIFNKEQLHKSNFNLEWMRNQDLQVLCHQMQVQKNFQCT